MSNTTASRERQVFGVLAGFEAMVAERTTPIAPDVVARVLRLVRETLDVPADVVARRDYQRKWKRAYDARVRAARPLKTEPVAKPKPQPRPVGRPRLVTDEQKKARKREANLRFRAKVAARTEVPVAPAVVEAAPAPVVAVPLLRAAPEPQPIAVVAPSMPAEASAQSSDDQVLALTDQHRADIETMMAEGHHGRRIAHDLGLPLGLVAIHVTACRERRA
ncbi:hypothetical protein ACQW02_19820 [Humitalea sp. 24SJ18S-53]|uniref:hypothetical protein n=1 Tax=Humitalea sp. 24SJ18S-53 TaxID=3422307 RepID=UPI003D66E728